jgi:predicted RNase H-like nuclease (RuvC/YqgF family)
LIVGIDPGVYTAYSILGLDGRLVKTGCAKELSHEDLVRTISSFGKPSIIATDVSPAPSFVLRIASRFHVRVFSPLRSLSVEEKKKIGKDIADPHIRDAYAASVKAYRHYENTLRRISNTDSSVDKDELKHLFLQGHKVSEARFMLEARAKPSDAHPRRASPNSGNPPGKAALPSANARMLALLEENENLRKALEIARAKNESLEEKLGRATSLRSIETSRGREVQRLQGQVARMQIYIDRLKRRKRKKGGNRPPKDGKGKR